jgi:hypothetical protein
MNSTLEKTLDDMDLNTLLKSTYQVHARHVFEILRLSELKKNYPVTQARHKLQSEFHRAIGADKPASRIMSFYRDCEAQCRVFKNARQDPQVIAALKVLSDRTKVLRGKTKVPLMSELPTETAFLLWSRVGSWSGALTLAGLKPMDNKQLLDATRRYAVKHVSPELLSQEIQDQLPPETMSALSVFCANIRKYGKYPMRKDISPKLVTQIKAAGFTVHRLFWLMGIHLV